MTDEPSNGELDRRITAGLADVRACVSSLGVELRSYFRELLTHQNELTAERIHGLAGRVERLEKDAEDRERRDEERERERAKEAAEYHRTRLTIFWGGAFVVLAAIVTVVLTSWTSHGTGH